MNLTYYKIFGVLCAGAVAALTVANIVVPDKEYSSAEKRNLAQFPDVSLTSVTDGSFMDDFDDYVTDQFIGRDTWMSLKVSLESLTGKNESQGVYKCDDGYLMERFDEPDTAIMEKMEAAILDFKERYPDVDAYFLLVPNAVSIMDELLPAYAITADQDAYIDEFYGAIGDEINTLDVRETLLGIKDETQIYYRTDHHWTSDAAYAVFVSIADEMDLTVDEYKCGAVTNAFNGSLTSESGFSAETLDTINVYLPETSENDVDYVVTYSEEQTRATTCYQTDYLNEDDPYQIFFGGNHPQIVIETDADTDRKLLVFKDSYANCFIPFLISSFKEITIVDPRYYYDDIDSLMSQNDFTDVLYLYNVNTLSTDNNLYAVLQSGQ